MKVKKLIEILSGVNPEAGIVLRCVTTKDKKQVKVDAESVCCGVRMDPTTATIYLIGKTRRKK